MKIGSFTPLWNQEIFIGPHFDMLKKLDRNVVMLQNGVMPSYRDNHGYSDQPDRSEYLIRKYFPKVEIYQSSYNPKKDFMAELYNEGMRMMQDCDIVFRLDPDMVWEDKDFDTIINYIRSTHFDSYRMDFAKDSINYYMTWDYEHGLKDAQEFDPLAVNPKIPFTGILDYTEENTDVMKLGWTCHHFRGWNKPKSTPATWYTQPNAIEAVKTFGDNGKWFICPDVIKEKMESWKQNLNSS